MPSQKLLYKAMGCTLAAGALLCAVAGFLRGWTAALLLGSALGLLCSALGLRLFFAAWRAAPHGGSVALYYVLRLAIVFGSVFAAMLIPAVDALGVLLPELPVIPILALMLALEKTPRDGGTKGD
ncbi:MAG: hypothetical protein RSG59_01640 [Ruthenibacterium sp.]